jgi:uncharacterized protein (TIGR02646 family)
MQHAVPEPSELAGFRRRHSGAAWDAPDFDAVRPIVRYQLNQEQEGLCVYCEGVLGLDDGHVEHIKSKGLNPPLTFAYDNLAHSCNGPGHCGHHKKRQVLPVEPRLNCNRYFSLMGLDGKLVPAVGLTDPERNHATESIRILGLNAPALAWQRRGYVESVRALADPADQQEFIASAPFRWSLKGL